ncbi:hypothetical protein CXG81DRAFT_27717 [Caulochytrium protostelioides]|uniref:DUF962-domain-containing protein n=1 Tax=Caulochytrium protostelioides TaxID=1555241 RepID=A0A4P9X3D4_9FUNG|nr:hypothetical protein CXG81DRAFT_27717 [Caulochytrium protostelioides]|eukprot:RKO99535.1 hypothetical protein CXG81DRAFT_27717 [Caulochytrium protostelioides]
MGLLNFREQLGLYAQYHNTLGNQLVHMLCVPLIMWSSIVFLARTTVGPPWPLDPVLPLNGAGLLLAGYASYYMLLEPRAAALYLPALVAMTRSAIHFSAGDGCAGYSPLVVAGLVFIASWLFQFLGHGLIEHRAPTLLDSPVQALVLAPFFVWIELLFFLGYRPALRRELQTYVDGEIAQWKATHGKKRA